MLKGIDVNERIEFISSQDVSEPKTVFVLRPLSGADMLKFGGGTNQDLLNMIIDSIVEVKNFEGAADAKSIVGSLNTIVLGELVQKINSINQVTRQDEKN